MVARQLTLTATRQQANTDGLTGLLNHRAVFEQLTRQLDEHGDDGQPLSVVMIDADSFKSINDGYGHPSGDVMLQQVAAVLRSVCRPQDLTARYGSDEFLLVLPGMTATEAKSNWLGTRSCSSPMGRATLSRCA